MANEFIVKNGLIIKDAYAFPSTDGTNTQVLSTNGAGVVTWQNAGATTSTYTLAFDDGDLESPGILTVTHSLNQQYCHVTVYDDNDLMIIPDEIEASGVNECIITLTSFGAITGTWNVRVSQ